MTITMLHNRYSFMFLSGLLVATGFLSACKKTEDASESQPSPEPAPAAPSTPTAPKTAPAELTGPAQPIGPAMLVVPGVGLSAIRFGATFETLARHMGAECDIRTETRCVYVAQAVEFTMKDGVVVGISAQRPGRQVKDPGSFPEKRFGAFNGGMVPEIMFGLHQHIVLEEFGEPSKKEPLTGPDGQVEKHIYPGLVLEYDKIANGNTILAAMNIIPDKKAPPHPRAVQSAQGTPAAAP